MITVTMGLFVLLSSPLTLKSGGVYWFKMCISYHINELLLHSCFTKNFCENYKGELRRLTPALVYIN